MLTGLQPMRSPHDSMHNICLSAAPISVVFYPCIKSRARIIEDSQQLLAELMNKLISVVCTCIGTGAQKIKVFCLPGTYKSILFLGSIPRLPLWSLHENLNGRLTQIEGEVEQKVQYWIHGFDGKILCNKTRHMREFPGGLVVRILNFYCCGRGSIPGQGIEIPQSVQCGQKKKKKKNQQGT